MESKLPLVSIGFPVFNSEKKVTRALDSLLTQNYSNFEIIISDNSSTDQTVAICKEYTKKDERISLNINDRNLGVSENFAIVYRKATGKYFMWAAADDFWEPGFINKLVHELESDESAGLAFCAVKRIFSDGSIKDIIQFSGASNPYELSNFKVAAKLLSPRAKTRAEKYGLFIYGLFRHEVLKGLWSVDEGIISYGERALLAPLALEFKFRYVDKVLFTKTVYETSFKKRCPDDEFSKKKKKLKYWKYYFDMMAWIIKSPNIPLIRKLYVFVILYYMSYRLVYKLKKKLK